MGVDGKNMIETEPEDVNFYRRGVRADLEKIYPPGGAEMDKLSKTAWAAIMNKSILNKNLYYFDYPVLFVFLFSAYFDWDLNVELMKENWRNKIYGFTGILGIFVTFFTLRINKFPS